LPYIDNLKCKEILISYGIKYRNNVSNLSSLLYGIRTLLICRERVMMYIVLVVDGKPWLFHSKLVDEQHAVSKLKYN